MHFVSFEARTEKSCPKFAQTRCCDNPSIDQWDRFQHWNRNLQLSGDHPDDLGVLLAYWDYEKTNSIGCRQSLKRTTSTHEARKSDQRKTKIQLPIKQKNLGTNIVPKESSDKHNCLKVSGVLWRLGILRCTFALKRYRCVPKSYFHMIVTSLKVDAGGYRLPPKVTIDCHLRWQSAKVQSEAHCFELLIFVCFWTVYTFFGHLT